MDGVGLGLPRCALQGFCDAAWGFAMQRGVMRCSDLRRWVAAICMLKGAGTRADGGHVVGDDGGGEALPFASFVLELRPLLPLVVKRASQVRNRLQRLYGYL